MTASLMPLPKQQYLTSTGAPLAGGKVYTYAAGTSTPQSTYSDSAGTTPNANPVVLDSRGEATIYWSGAYKVILKDSAGNTIYTQDNVITGPTGSLSDYLPLAGGNLTGPLTSNVTVGAVSPINGTSGLGALPSAAFTNNGAGTSLIGITSSISSTGNNTTSSHFLGVTQSVAIWYLYGNGTTSYTSDVRIKFNIKPMKSCLDKWEQVNFVGFDRRQPEDIDLTKPAEILPWKEGNPEPENVGVLSQQIAEIWPELTVEATHNLDGTQTPGPKVLQVIDNILYGPVLGKVVQELIALVKSQGQRIAELEAR